VTDMVHYRFIDENNGGILWNSGEDVRG